MKKTILYLALLILIGGGVYFLLFQKSDNPFGQDEANFSVKDTAAIQTIYLVRNNGESIQLDRNPAGGWIVNKQYPALPSTVQILMGSIYGQTAQYPLPEKQHNNAIKAMTASSVKVEIYGRERKKLTTFYVGGEGPDAQGTIMLTEGAKTAYIVTLAGLIGVLNPRYSTNIEDWRDRTVFRAQPSEIRSISVDYPSEPLNSFTISQEGGKLSLATKEDVSSGRPLNEKRTASYLKFFSNINMEGYAHSRGLDTVLPQVPKHCVMELTTTANAKQHVDIYYMPINKRSKNLLRSSAGTPDDFDADRFFAVLNNYKDTAIIQNFVFNKLLRKAYEFYEPDAPVDPKSATTALKQ